MKIISVIIPCYNVEHWIDRCMVSIAVQTIGIDNLEIICIDDASTDHTWEHLQKWEQDYPENVLLIRQEVNQRQGAVRNLGLQYASADWIAFVDADDWLEPDYFEQLYMPTEHYVCDVAACSIVQDYSGEFRYLEDAERDEGEDQYISSDTVEGKKRQLICKTLDKYSFAKIIRKELLLEHQLYFPEGLVYEDNYWHPLLHIYADYIYLRKKKLYHYFMHASSTINARNEAHHLDRITIQLMKWEDYEKRGLLQTFRSELEYDFICHALCFMRTLVSRYDQPSYSHYRLQREVIRQKIPDSIMDAYEDFFSGVDAVCFDALHRTLDRIGFQAFVEQAQRYIVRI